MHTVTSDRRGGIYAIRNVQNGNQYIGSAVDFRIRHKIHYRELTRGIHHSVVLQRAWDKYGEDAFEFVVLELVPNREDLIRTEQAWFDKEKPVYNIAPIAGSSLGIKRRPESKEKMRQAQLGMVHTEERRRTKSLAQGGENHWTQKKRFSEQARINMSNAHKKLYAEGYVHPQKGTKKTPEQLEVMRQRASKPVLQFSKDGTFIKEWSSVKEAGKAMNIAPGGISAVCKGKKHTRYAAGFIWKHKTPPPTTPT